MIASLSSSTSAGRIKRKLYDLGIYSSVIQTPKPLAKDGCGYSLRFDDSLKSIVGETAIELGIKIKGFYYEIDQSGKKQYKKIDEVNYDLS